MKSTHGKVLQNDTDGSFSEWERLSEFDDMDMDSLEDVSDWEL